MTRRFLAAVMVSALLWLPIRGFTQHPGPASQNADMSSADMLYRSGRFAEAATKFQAMVKADPKLLPAQVGLIHSLLRAQEIDQAQADRKSVV